jgi:hypothetical protein
VQPATATPRNNRSGDSLNGRSKDKRQILMSKKGLRRAELVHQTT